MKVAEPAAACRGLAAVGKAPAATRPDAHPGKDHES